MTQEEILEAMLVIGRERQQALRELHRQRDLLDAEIATRDEPFQFQLTDLKHNLEKILEQQGQTKAKIQTDLFTYSYFKRVKWNGEALEAMRQELPQLNQCREEVGQSRLMWK